MGEEERWKNGTQEEGSEEEGVRRKRIQEKRGHGLIDEYGRKRPRKDGTERTACHAKVKTEAKKAEKTTAAMSFPHGSFLFFFG